MLEPARPRHGFFHISEAANLGLHAMIILAAEPSGPLRIRQICEALPASENHLAKVLQRLARAGLVSSTRGPLGGFVLARPAGEVTLLDIYQAIEGPAETHACLLGRTRCSGECVLGELVARTNSEIGAQLQRTRLSDVTGTVKRSKPSPAGARRRAT